MAGGRGGARKVGILLEGRELERLREPEMGRRKAKEKRCFVRCAKSTLYVIEW